MRKETIKTLADLCMDINGLPPVAAKGSRGNRRPANGVFRFSGHAGTASTDMHRNGWKTDAGADMEWALYTASGNFNIEGYGDAYGPLLALRDSLQEGPGSMPQTPCMEDCGYGLPDRARLKRQGQAYGEAERGDNENGGHYSGYYTGRS